MHRHSKQPGDGVEESEKAGQRRTLGKRRCGLRFDDEVEQGGADGDHDHEAGDFQEVRRLSGDAQHRGVLCGAPILGIGHPVPAGEPIERAAAGEQRWAICGTVSEGVLAVAIMTARPSGPTHDR